MDAYPSATATSPESYVSVAFPSDPTLPVTAIDPVAPLMNAEENRIAEFIGAGENPKDAALQNQRKRRSFWARGRSRFRGWYGTRLGAGGRGKVHHHPFPVNTIAIHDHAGDVQHEKSTIVESYGHQLFAPLLVHEINPLSTTRGEVPLESSSASKPSLLSQASLLRLTWCDICRVDCNSLKVLEKHRTGKRHKRTLQLMEKMEGRPRPEMAGELAADDNHLNPKHLSESVAARIVGIHANTKCDARSANLKKKRRRNASPERSRVCIPCNAACNSQAMFESHLAGKKHTTRMKHLQGPNTIYGLMSACIPSNQSPSSAPACRDSLPLNYGLMNC